MVRGGRVRVPPDGRMYGSPYGRMCECAGRSHTHIID